MTGGDLTVGVFDSGMGGLTVLRELLRRPPAARLLYLGDTARLPYGTKSRATVERYALKLGGFLAARGIDLLVVACNTASAVALDALAASLRVPVVGVVEPGARAAVRAGGRVGVLGTEATILSGAYTAAITRLAPAAEVAAVACPLFVPLVEEGWTEGEVPRLVARRYLGELGPVETLLLGCTHYPLLAPLLADEAPGAAVVDSATALADEVRGRLGEFGGEPEVRFFVTDGAERFMTLGSRILGHPLGEVELIDV